MKRLKTRSGSSQPWGRSETLPCCSAILWISISVLLSRQTWTAQTPNTKCQITRSPWFSHYIFYLIYTNWGKMIGAAFFFINAYRWWSCETPYVFRYGVIWVWSNTNTSSRAQSRGQCRNWILDINNSNKRSVTDGMHVQKVFVKTEIENRLTWGQSPVISLNLANQ